MQLEPLTDNRTSKITLWAIPCLIFGAILGHYVKSDEAKTVFDVIGTLWMNYLKLCAIPLVLLLLFSAIVRLPNRESAKTVSNRFFLTMVLILLFGAVIAWLIHTLKLSFFGTGSFSISGEDVASPEPEPISEWFKGLIPSNFFEAAVAGNILPLVIVATIFAFAVRCSSEKIRENLVTVFENVLAIFALMIRWGIMLLPLGGFALAFVFAGESGTGFVEIAFQFLLLSVCTFFSVTVLLILITCILCKRSIFHFLKTITKSVATAASTRSSIASLPSMVSDVNTGKLATPESTAFALPLAVSIFKANRTVSSTLKLLFVASVSSVVLTFPQVVVFVGTMMLLSIASPGIPRSGTSSGLGIYLALGLPLSTLILLDVVEPVIDIFKTIYNVVADICITMFVDLRNPA